MRRFGIVFQFNRLFTEADAILKQARARGNNPLLVEYRKAERRKGTAPRWSGVGGVPLINLSPPGKPRGTK